MRYGLLYKNFCEKLQSLGRKDNGKYTIHHILFRSMGGQDVEENRVLMTPREHYIAHRIFAKKYQKQHPEIYYLLNSFANGMKGANGVRYCDFNFYWKKYATMKANASKEKNIQEALKIAQEETMRLIRLPGADAEFITKAVMAYSTGKDYVSCSQEKKEK